MEATARIASNGNIKLGKLMGTFSKLFGNDTFDTKYGKVSGTCGHHCEGCKGKCYVRKSYRYGSVINGHARNTLAFRNNLDEAFYQINLQLSRKRKPFQFIRINQSGELESTTELVWWIVTARKNPNTAFYLYTKNFEAVREVANSNIKVPDNFTVLISVWHEYGITEYNEFKHLPWIKCFVYCDGFDYEAHGLQIETMCKAYDEKGKMNHDITCDKCKKCIKSQFKIIGCNEH
jgi:hypothetical protein